MFDAQPAVSVVVPCYDSIDYLQETVESLKAQTLRASEIILVDDGSRDGTRELIKALIAASPRHVIRHAFQENAGQAAARNRGIAMARGRYILPLDSDDLIAPNMAEVCASVLDSKPDIALVFTDREEFGDRAAFVQAGVFKLDRLKYFNQLPYCALYRKEMWEAVGGYRVNVRGFNDWDFWIAAAALCFRSHYQPGAFLKHRRRKGSQMWRDLEHYDRLYATIILNNRSIYSGREVAAAEALLTTAVAAPLFRAARFLFMGYFLGTLELSAAGKDRNANFDHWI